MGIEAPITISVKLRDINNLFHKIVNAAQQPHLSIPETEAGRNRKQYRRIMNRSLMFVSGMFLLAKFAISLKLLTRKAKFNHKRYMLFQ